jgi:hypothetical protein
LIATTGRIATGGKKVARARQYPLRFAENKEVNMWVRKLWRHPWKGKVHSEGVGRYLLAPIIPIGPGGEEFQEKWHQATVKSLEKLKGKKK